MIARTLARGAHLEDRRDRRPYGPIGDSGGFAASRHCADRPGVAVSVVWSESPVSPALLPSCALLRLFAGSGGFGGPVTPAGPSVTGRAKPPQLANRRDNTRICANRRLGLNLRTVERRKSTENQNRHFWPFRAFCDKRNRQNTAIVHRKRGFLGAPLRPAPAMRPPARTLKVRAARQGARGFWSRNAQMKRCG